MDLECSQLLPNVCAVLADPRHPISDDTCLEKLLDWFQSVTSHVPVERLLEEHPCLTGLLRQVLKLGDPDPSLLSFILRLAGIFAAHERGFQHLMEEDILLGLFGEGTCSSAMWGDASVRSGWVQGLHSMVQHEQAASFLSQCGAVDVVLKLQVDPSLFVASAANQLLVHIWLFCIKMGKPESADASDWPASAHMILAHLEKSLASGIPPSVTQSLKTLSAVYGSCTDALAGILWPRMAVLIDSLLEQKPGYCAPYLVDLLLGVARSPAFSNPDCDLWILMKRALKNLTPSQSGPLALGIMKLKHCPQAVSLQAVSVLLHPMECILKASSGHPVGVLGELVSDAAAVENLLSTKSSCAGLLCQSLSHLTELCHMDCLTIQIPEESVLNCVVIVLHSCIGQAVPSSSAGSHISRFLIGCLRVQRSALDTLGALSHWPMDQVSLVKTYNVLFAYLENPDTDPTVLKKTFQASVKWLQASSADVVYWTHSDKFLQDLFPVLPKRLCSPFWETRDSALEFLTHLTAVLKEHEGFRQVLSSSRVLQLVWGLLKDPESYVRASAVSSLGQLINIPHLYPTLAEGDSPATEPLKRENLVAELLDILAEDTEGFPRRAVAKVFTDWLKNGHIQNFEDKEKLLSRILHVAHGDLDWEVKVNVLELAEVFVAQTLGMCVPHSCPYTVGLPSNSSALITEAMQKCNRVGLFQFLLAALCDCDRPVVLRSCDILISVKSKLYEAESLTESLAAELHGTEWLECTLREWRIKDNTRTEDANWVMEILKNVDLDRVKSSLSRSSDYIQNSPESLLRDILATAGTVEEHGADCY
ncbi:hypothetical protein FKM82_002980 [Ascaphus truei]